MARDKKSKRHHPRPVHFLTQEELSRLLRAIKNKRDHAIFLTAYRYGLRASEVGELQKTDLDLKQGRISINRLKGSLSGIYPIQPDLLKLLRSHLKACADVSPYLFLSNRGDPIDRRTLWYLMQKYASAAGIPPQKQKFHSLKHSLATHLLDAGADISFVKDWLGHANIQNTTIYARLSTTTRDHQARKFFTSHRVL